MDEWDGMKATQQCRPIDPDEIMHTVLETTRETSTGLSALNHNITSKA